MLLLPITISGGLHDCAELAALDSGDASCGTTYNICCSHQKNSNQFPPSDSSRFNCFDGDLNGDSSDGGSTGDGKKYYGHRSDGVAATGHAYMCIEDDPNDSSTSSNWVDPTSTIDGVIVGASGGAPLCPGTARRRMEQMMEMMYSNPSSRASQSESERTTKAIDEAEDTEIPPCRMGALDDVRRLDSDQCNPLATPEKLPLEILSRNGNTVTFTLSQVWKQCSSGSSSINRNMDWIAVDFVVPGPYGGLECFNTAKPDCGIVNAFTAKCTEGLALIDIYALDETETSMFFQTDGSALIIPDACTTGKMTDDATRACKFRYVLNCLELCETNETGSWWLSEFFSTLTDAFRFG